MGNEWMLLSFAGCSVLAAGFVSAAALGEVRGHPWKENSAFALAALILIVCGGAASLVNLGHPKLVLGALHNPGSGIFWELVTTAALAVCCCGYLIANWLAGNEKTIRGFAVAGVVCAAALLVSIGKSFYMPWRTALNTYAVLMAFLGWGVVAASLSVMTANALAEKTTQKAEWAAFAVGYLLVWLYPAALFAGSLESNIEIMHWLNGELAPLFWGATVVCGMLVPASLAWFGRRHPISTAAALLFTLIGTTSFQWLVLKIGMADWQFFG